MNPSAPLYPPKATPTPEPQGDAVVPPSSTASETPASTTMPTPAPRPVMSAKDAINAMYATEKARQNPQLVSSAREAVNAASRTQARNLNSASNLHHGSLQKIQRIQSLPKNLESTRTSASALLKTDADAKDIPVVHTSLKLGANARPKKSDPVVLPAGARMARVAQSVDGDESLGPGMPRRSTVKVVTSGRNGLAAAPRSARRIRDPQMLSGGRRVIPTKPLVGLPSASPANSAPALPARSTSIPVTSPNAPVAASRPAATSAPQYDISSPLVRGSASPKKLIRPRRFRATPRNQSVAGATTVTADTTYAMSEPPKLAARRRSVEADADLGVVRAFRPSKLPEPIGDAAPIGRLAGQRVASGHGGPAESALTIKTENTSNYSFSRRESKAPMPASYAPADKSPFLKSVTVEKRPLSDNSAVPSPISLPRTPEPKLEKSSRKNSYQKKADAKANLPARPTVIVPSSRRSKAPLFFLILFTIILGAVVGAAVYLCFFQ